mgnify:CR=1 FL=1
MNPINTSWKILLYETDSETGPIGAKPFDLILLGYILSSDDPTLLAHICRRLKGAITCEEGCIIPVWNNSLLFIGKERPSSTRILKDYVIKTTYDILPDNNGLRHVIRFANE